MKACQKILSAAVIATIIVVVGTIAYFQFSPITHLRISTTTSLYDPGLLDQIKTQYESNHKVSLDIIAQGTGLALASARIM